MRIEPIAERHIGEPIPPRAAEPKHGQHRAGKRQSLGPSERREAEKARSQVQRRLVAGDAAEVIAPPGGVDEMNGPMKADMPIRADPAIEIDEIREASHQHVLAIVELFASLRILERPRPPPEPPRRGFPGERSRARPP